MAITKVKQGEVIKTALLLGILVSLPKTIYLYNGIMEGNLNFSMSWVVDFMYRYLFFFCYSWSVIQLNANIDYDEFKWPSFFRWIVILLVNIVLAITVVKIFKICYPLVNGRSLRSNEMGWVNFTFINLSIVLFFIARLLRVSTDKQESRIENEQLKQQNLENELAALKNQIDPHFLFNSLNSLSSLIRENENATKFVNKLSYMYRYILQSGETNLVPVKDELKFLDSYIFLMKTRYRDRIEIQVNINERFFDREIPPLALQSLVENSVKHNEISSTNPLIVKVYAGKDSLIVENPIRSRSTLAEGMGTGLYNLKKRYLLLLKKEVLVSTVNDIFKVELPLKEVA
ncbi:sensor histidine kinase [Maribacter huludaoensis]|uniref:sensor histidine kinase n=1 Tax=Maribacter huludaoensis TaxID=3030010 RepID=UPI0023EB8B11|nr:histidine kinase [Maribacter huludaoensis]MDF4220757.1 histidine kinase [Maribacter huludaoensis]